MSETNKKPQKHTALLRHLERLDCFFESEYSYSTGQIQQLIDCVSEFDVKGAWKLQRTFDTLLARLNGITIHDLRLKNSPEIPFKGGDTASDKGSERKTRKADEFVINLNNTDLPDFSGGEDVPQQVKDLLKEQEDFILRRYWNDLKKRGINPALSFGQFEMKIRDTVKEMFGQVDWTPSDDGWMPWSSGDRPVGADDLVEVKLDDGTMDRCRAGDYYWMYTTRASEGRSPKIVAWRPVLPKKVGEYQGVPVYEKTPGAGAPDWLKEGTPGGYVEGGIADLLIDDPLNASDLNDYCLRRTRSRLDELSNDGIIQLISEYLHMKGI